MISIGTQVFYIAMFLLCVLTFVIVYFVAYYTICNGRNEIENNADESPLTRDDSPEIASEQSFPIYIGVDEYGFFARDKGSLNHTYLFDRENDTVIEVDVFAIKHGTIVRLGSQWVRFCIPRYRNTIKLIDSFEYYQLIDSL
ncbi:MAG: hypothetical protein IKU19_04220 [Clostridia bacterium]|nr:hypothetical protein [Clostridia bacterium]